MSQRNLTLKLLRLLDGLYKPEMSEVLELAKLAKLNKLYLAFLRNVDYDDYFRRDKLIEEFKFKEG